MSAVGVHQVHFNSNAQIYIFNDENNSLTRSFLLNTERNLFKLQLIHKYICYFEKSSVKKHERFQI